MSREPCPLCLYPYMPTKDEEVARLRKLLGEALKLTESAHAGAQGILWELERQKDATRAKAAANGLLSKKFSKLEAQCVRLLNENATLRKSQRMPAETESENDAEQ